MLAAGIVVGAVGGAIVYGAPLYLFGSVFSGKVVFSIGGLAGGTIGWLVAKGATEPEEAAQETLKTVCLMVAKKVCEATLVGRA